MKHRFFNSLILMVLLAIRAHAVQMEPLSIDELTAKSDAILKGRVESLTTFKDDQGRILTKVILNVQEVWKGPVSTNHFTIVLAGGILGDEKTVVSGQVQYLPGEDIIAFLVLNQRGEGVTLGLVQGKFNVHTDSTSGLQTVHSRFHGRKPDSRPASARISTQAVVSLSDDLTLDSLKEKVSGRKDSK
ncbi:MAG: hypothetical protein JWN25_472 [Verrucomicrobiales bacterium]|nr:hypothetical protein [Verrucomicrobiales bacterium]